MRIKLPVWVIVVVIIVVSMAASAVITEITVDRSIRYTLNNVITESYHNTGHYPDWFLEWLNTEYYLQMQELQGIESEGQ